MGEHRTFCRICQAYCGLVVETDGGAVTAVRADRDHPTSRGYTCSKGRGLRELHESPERILAPRLRGAVADWEHVLDDLAATIADTLERRGPEGVAFFRGTASYFDSAGLVSLGRLIAGLRTPQVYTTSTIDQVARFWVARLMCGQHHVLPLVDEERTAMTLLVGTNPPASHGHVTAWPDPVRRLRRLAANGSLWCLDVRATESSAVADGHLTPRPGSDWAVLGHLVRQALRRGGDADFLAAHTHGVESLRTAVEPLDLRRAAALADVAVDDLEQLDGAVQAAGRVAVQTGTGTTMGANGDVTEWMAWALMAVTGSLDRPGGVWFNPGHVASAAARRITPPDEPGPASRDLVGRFGERPTAALVDEIEAGTIEVLLVAGGNPLRTVPGSQRLRQAFASLRALAVFDVVESATAAAATHLLACAAQLERSDITMVQSMSPVRAGQYTPALLPRPGDTWPMFDVVSGLATRLGLGAAAMDSEALLSSLVGDDDAELRARGILVDTPVYGWFTDEMLPADGWDLAPAPLVERLAAVLSAPAAPMPVVLTPRRQVGRMNSLEVGRDEPAALLVNSADAAEWGIGPDALVVLRTTAGGEIVAPVKLDPTIRRGVVSLPHGHESPDVSELTVDTDTVHPEYGMPVLSGVAVEITGLASTRR